MRSADAQAAQAIESQLMRRVQADDPEAFGLLYDRLAPRALRVARTVSGGSENAADIVQDAFLSACRGRAMYRSERGEVSAWLMGIVRNRAIDSLRSSARHYKGRDHREGLTETLPAAGNREADVAEGDQARQLRAVLTGLPIAQREVIALAFFGELSHSEISRQLELPLGTVKGRMRLGLEKMRQDIADEAAPGAVDPEPEGPAVVVCAGCGVAASRGQVLVCDINPHTGSLHPYHQACAPSVDARMLREASL